jgi:cell division protein FtsW
MALEFLNQIGEKLSEFMSGFSGDILSWCSLLIRFLLPILAFIIVMRCIKSLLSEKHEGEEWGYLSLPNGSRMPLNHWENIIGRSKASDIFMDYPTLSRSHAAVIRDDKGRWTVYDLESKGGVYVNGTHVEGEMSIKSGDVITLAGVDLVFVPLTKQEERIQAESRRRPGRIIRPGGTLVFLTEFQVLMAAQLCIASIEDFHVAVPISFGILILIMWLCYIITRILRRVAFEVETIAFFLCTIGQAVTASSVPGDVYKQIVLLLAGILLFFAIGWFLRDLNRAKKLRWPIAIAGLCLLGVNLVLSEAVFGAKNWLSIGGISFQPSEFVKIAFVFAGAATLDRLFAKRNLILFIAFSAACVGALALMSDFGTAAVFFVAYLVIAFLRSGNFATIFLSVGGTGLAGVLAISVKPYIASRFSTWRKAWQYVNEGGYQQTRAMSAAASGGLIGVGAGNGWLHEIAAADTDLVFAMVSEELGLIIALLSIAAVIGLAVFTVRSSAIARSSFYVIGACAAVSILLFQIILNVLGSLDILPFTGVTFPFISKGGSSLIASWGLLAFIKAADTRQNASFAIKMPKKEKTVKVARGRRNEEPTVDFSKDDPYAVGFDQQSDYDYDDYYPDFDIDPEIFNDKK